MDGAYSSPRPRDPVVVSRETHGVWRTQHVCWVEGLRVCLGKAGLPPRARQDRVLLWVCSSASGMACAAWVRVVRYARTQRSACGRDVTGGAACGDRRVSREGSGREATRRRRSTEGMRETRPRSRIRAEADFESRFCRNTTPAPRARLPSMIHAPRHATTTLHAANARRRRARLARTAPLSATHTTP